MSKKRFEACIIGGAIGDAWGSSYENEIKENNPTTFYYGQKKEPERIWAITDDTQLTLATCEALCDSNRFTPDLLANWFVRYYQQRKLIGIGASTLKAIIELEAGGHWSQVGRTGEYAAGNGAAMRIAPLAFINTITNEDIRNSCRITHRNDEAYTGALAVIHSIRAILNKSWLGDNSLFDILIPQLPDTRVRDRLIEINSLPENTTIAEIARLGNNGYVVNSIPFAIFAASVVLKTGMTSMFQAIIDSGGDTDTNASIAGQIAGTLIGKENIPVNLIDQLKLLKQYKRIKEIVDKTKTKIE